MQTQLPKMPKFFFRWLLFLLSFLFVVAVFCFMAAPDLRDGDLLTLVMAFMVLLVGIQVISSAIAGMWRHRPPWNGK